MSVVKTSQPPTIAILIIVVIFLFTVSSVSAQFAGGSGTQADPWQIETAEHLNNLRNYLGLEHNDKHFIQTADIDLGIRPWNERDGWYPIGDRDNPFFGSFDGNNHQIANLTIRRDTHYVGLFGYTYVADLTSIRLVNADIEANSSHVGVLAGLAGHTHISDCYVEGDVTGRYYVGGITGSLSLSTVHRSSFDGLIQGLFYIGGITGQSFASEINSSYAVGLATGNSLIGGIAGEQRGNCIVRDSYSAMPIQGNDRTGQTIGGLVGRNRSSSIVRSYAIGSIYTMFPPDHLGGLIGEYDGGVIESSYWNSETSGLDESPRGTPLTTEQMINAESYEGWDFETVWQISEESYPRLSWQEQPSSHNIPGAFNLTAAANNELGLVDLSWDILDIQQSPSFFRIYRNNRPIAEVDYPLTEYRDLEAVENYNHRYYVTAIFLDEDLERKTAPSNTKIAILAVTFPGGDGSVGNPYQVNSAATLNLVRNDLEAHYIQTADIDLGLSPWNDDLGWVPLDINPHNNEVVPFSGSYDGNGHLIRNLTINTPDRDQRGLFRRLSNATVKNLGLLNVDIKGKDYVGGITGRALDNCIIESCFVTGRINGNERVGGIAGQIGTFDSGSQIVNCYSNTLISTKSTRLFHPAGGIVGLRFQGDVIGNYTTGSIYSLVESRSVNAVIGSNSDMEGEVRDNYWNIETTLQQRGASSGEMPGSTTREMIQQETYTGFNFEEIWRIDENSSLPYLSWQGQEPGEHNQPPLLPPLNLTGVGGVDLINLFWDSPNPEMGIPDGYDIYRNNVKINQEPVAENQFSDTDATPWVVQRYQVSAVYGDDESWLGKIVFVSAISFAGGSGIEADPFLIENAEQLDGIRYSLDKHYRQVADINLQSYGNWESLTDGFNNPFSGSFDGDGYVISGLTMDRVGAAGLFNTLNGATISNVSLEDINMTDIFSGGGLAATVRNSRITNSYTEGRVSSAGSGSMGGFIGLAGSGAVIIDCWSDIEISGSTEVGGFVGLLTSGGLIQRCFSKGTVSARTCCSMHIGGFVGFNHNATIIDSYTRATIDTHERVSQVGGFAGLIVGGTITNCYAAGELNSVQQAGGLVGDGRGIVTNSYWDMEVSGYQNSVAGEGRHTRQMVYPHDQDTYTDWDFEAVWQGDENGLINDGYPVFSWQTAAISPHPNIASNPQPRNWQENVSVALEQLSWSYISNPQFTDPVGFRVYFNDTGEFDDGSPYVWVPYEEGQENFVTAEILPPFLGLETFFYWKVVPTTIPQNSTTITRRKNKTSLHYNSLSNRRQNAKTPQLATRHSQLATRGDAEGVPVWCFLTEADFTNVEEVEATPLATLLVGNYPNPFNPETTISFSLAEPGKVTIEVFNIMGQKVTKIINEHLTAGYHRVVWKGTDDSNREVGSGVYLYIMKTRDYDAAGKMILLK